MERLPSQVEGLTGMALADREQIKELTKTLSALKSQVDQLATSQPPPVSPSVEDLLPRVMQGCMMELHKEVAKAIAVLQGEWDLHKKEWQEAIANDMETLAMDRKALQDAAEGLRMAPSALQAEARVLIDEALTEQVPLLASKAAKRALDFEIQVLREDLPKQKEDLL